MHFANFVPLVEEMVLVENATLFFIKLKQQLTFQYFRQCSFGDYF